MSYADFFIILAMIEENGNIFWQSVGKILSQGQAFMPIFLATPKWRSEEENPADLVFDLVFGKVF